MLREKINDIILSGANNASKATSLVDLVSFMVDEKRKVFQDEIDRLKEQHAAEIEKLETQIKAGIDLQTILFNTIEIERNTHKGYRQAVKDILGGELNG